jgi:hypothetical protein
VSADGKTGTVTVNVDGLSHEWLMKFVEHRRTDSRGKKFTSTATYDN